MEKITEGVESLTLQNLPIKPAQAEEAAASGHGHVYLIQEKNNTLPDQNFKVGRTGSPSSRLSNLQTGNPRLLDYVCCPKVTNMRDAEDAALKALAVFPCTLGGGKEWFTVSKNKINTLITTFNTSVSKYIDKET